jgi:non-heme chloroperoxidase
MKIVKALSLLVLTTAACVNPIATADGVSPAEEATPAENAESTSQELVIAPTVRSVALSTNVTLSYLEQGKKNGDPVIFLHGYTDSHHSFDLNLPHLSRDHHVYALDQRGHGSSSKPACCYTQVDFARDVVAFMNALGLKKASLVGHSMGSFIAQQVALDAPKRVKKLVLIGSGPTLTGNAVALDFAPVVDSLVDPIDPVFVRDFQASTFFRPIPPSFLDTAVDESLKAPASVWRQAFAGLLAEDHTSRLCEIKAKTLVFWGDQDIFFSAADEQVLVNGIRHAKLLTYTQTGHGLHVEEPLRFVRDLEKFLD